MATYVLVHGGGHGAWCWDRLAPLLRNRGHRVFTPTLAGVGERADLLSPDIDLDTHIAEVVTLLAEHDLRDVILTGHSYGGMVITGAADRACDRIGQLVYLDAAIPRDGEALIDTSPGIRDIGQRDLRTVEGVELVLWPDSLSLRIFGLTAPDDIAFAHGKLTPHPWKSFTQPLCLADPAAVDAMPRTIINCTGTLANRPRASIQRWLTADRVWEIDTGHDLMITAPMAVADMLLELA